METQVNAEQLQHDVDAQQERTYTWTYANGRRYAASEMGHYYMPNDAPEIQRLNRQHWMLTEVKGGSLIHAPLNPNDNFRILDVGCGSGIWCLQMAEDFPAAKIVGVDLAPVQPANKPKNVEWILLEFENGEWPFPENHFDLIHMSLVHGCVADWEKTLAKIVRYLKPGGYIEHQEFAMADQYLVDTSGKRTNMVDVINGPAYTRWPGLMCGAADKRGRTLHLGPKLKGWQERAGLQKVTQAIYPISCGTWPVDEQQRLIGAQWLHNMLVGIEGFTYTLFTTVLGWSEQDTNTYIEQCKMDLRNNDLRKMIDTYVVYGQKPAAA